MIYYQTNTENMAERKRVPLTGRTWTIKAEGFDQLARDFVPRITPKKDIDHTIDAVDNFLQDLLKISNVQAVAFLSVEQPLCPTTVSIEVVTPPFSINEDVKSTFRATREAIDKLKKNTANIVPVGSQFINSTGIELDVLERDLRKGWSEDNSLTLLGFVKFQRD